MAPELPPGFRRQMTHWLGAEWSMFEQALLEAAHKAVRLHRVSTVPHLVRPQVKHALCAIADQPLPVPHDLRAVLGDPVPWQMDAFYIDHDSALGKTVYHETGAFYIQEPSAMAVVAALNPRPGERILDLAAAPGGKTTSIGHRLAGSGVLVANEIHPTRVVTLAQNLERLGVPAIVVNETPDRLAERWAGCFDAVLVDAPCSGEGMFRKDPQAVHEWRDDSPHICAERQRAILRAAVELTKPGGRLVYSTCTFNPVENEQVAAWALANLPVRILPLPLWPGWDTGRADWAGDVAELAHTRRLWPHRGRGEGHFVAAFEVLDGPRAAGRAHRASTADRVPEPVRQWLQQAVRIDVPAVQLSVHNDHVYATVADLPLHGLRVLRPGLPIATVHNGRIEPHHAFAMALHKDAPVHAIEVTPSEAARYLSGETLDERPGRTGPQWIHVHGLPVGWGRAVPGRINNLYPKGLRKTHCLWDLTGTQQ